MSDEFGVPRMIRPLLGSLLGGLRSRRVIDGAITENYVGGPDDRVPNDSQLESLIQDGMLVLPPRYFIGYFLDMLI